jgi:hypothetical protein
MIIIKLKGYNKTNKKGELTANVREIYLWGILIFRKIISY